MAVLACLALAYVAWCALLYALQTQLLYPGSALRDPVGPAPSGVRIQEVLHPDGVSTELWLSGSAEPLLVYLHGNGERIDHQDAVLGVAAEAGFTLALPEYRGYGRSGGTPSEAAVTADLVRIVDRLRADARERPVVYWGRSIGASFAAQLARHRPPAALILQTPFLRIDRLALRYLAPPWLVRDRFRSDLALRNFARPVLLLKHARDQLAPPAQADALHAILPGSTLVTLDAGHNDSGPSADVRRERSAIFALLAKARTRSP